MPLYLVHGFRWSRQQIRIFIILNYLEDATADNLQTPTTITTLRHAMFTKYPHLKKTLPNLTFIEQHDTDDLRTGAQPYAFVADTVREAASAGGSPGLSMDVGDTMGRGGGLGNETWDGMADLRDAIAEGEAIGWYAVWNGDPERGDIGEEEYDDDEGMDGGSGRVKYGDKINGTGNGSQVRDATDEDMAEDDEDEEDDEEEVEEEEEEEEMVQAKEDVGKVIHAD